MNSEMEEEIKKDLIKNGIEPDDFKITVSEDRYEITPKWFYETKQIAKKEDKPIKEDVDVVAETAVFAMMDIEDLAQMLVHTFQRINELEAKING